MHADEQPEHRARRETAGNLAVASVPIATLADSVAHVRQLIERERHDATDLVLVTDRAGTYQGVVPAHALMQSPPDAIIAELIRRDWPSVTPDLDQEHAAEAAIGLPAAAVPVVTPTGHPMGILTPSCLMHVIRTEHREDMDRLVGVLRERSRARHALEDPPLRRLANRLPWLLVGLALSSIATAMMASFEHALQSHVAIAFFIPALVYLTDAVGTQSEAVAVRGLSARKRSLRHVLSSELATGALIGLALGAIAFLGIWMAFASVPLALGVAISLVAASTVACGIGLMLPWLLTKFGLDPALGAGPVATILQDVLTIAIYFLVITRLVGA